MFLLTGHLPRWYLGFAAAFFFLLLMLPMLANWLAVGPDKPKPVYNGNPAKPQVALACNVFWGEEHLPAMLDALDRHNVKITFFLGGTWVAEHPEIARELARRGHELANHSYSHPHPNSLSRESNKAQIIRTEKLVAEVTGVTTKLYAPPYGEFNATVLEAAAELGYTTIMWSIDTIDWRQPPAEKIISKVSGKLHNGAIILIHPTVPTAQALPELLFRIKEKGFSILPVSSILE